jgi:hypothetical protein
MMFLQVVLVVSFCSRFGKRHISVVAFEPFVPLFLDCACVKSVTHNCPGQERLQIGTIKNTHSSDI